MLYWAINNEPDTGKILSTALEDGKIVLLPSINGEELYPVIYKKDMPVQAGKYNIKEPVYKEGYPLENIDIVVVPAIAFDHYGYRIGYGKGYYDRFLKKLGTNTVTVGLSFSECVIEKLPTDGWDIPVDIIITEMGVQIKEQKYE